MINTYLAALLGSLISGQWTGATRINWCSTLSREGVM